MTQPTATNEIAVWMGLLFGLVLSLASWAVIAALAVTVL